MKVAIDITSLIYDRGVSRYTSNLIQALSEIQYVKLYLFGYSFRDYKKLSKLAKKLIKSCKNPGKHKLKLLRIPPSAQNRLWQAKLNPIKKTFPDVDVIHSWDWLQPPDENVPLVSTIHDLAILKHPETANPLTKIMHHKSWTILKKRKAQIITPSYSVKKDIISLLRISPSYINVVHEAVPKQTSETMEKLSSFNYNQIKIDLGLDKPYILFVGTQEPRKNLSRLIKAWMPLAENYKLIIAGADSWDAELKALKEKHITNLQALGHVTHEELLVLYQEAKMLAFPSIDEGFGLPILEAFFHGIPVLTSNRGAMREIAGNAAEFVNPESIVDIRRGLNVILNETEKQEKLRERRMIIRNQLFSWKKAAIQTFKVYQKAIKS